MLHIGSVNVDLSLEEFSVVCRMIDPKDTIVAIWVQISSFHELSEGLICALDNLIPSCVSIRIVFRPIEPWSSVILASPRISDLNELLSTDFYCI